MQRRAFLAGTSAAMVGLSGCASNEGSESEDGYPWPESDADALSEWELIGEESPTHGRSVWGLGVTVHERTRIYDQTALRADAEERTSGAFDGSLAMFIASRMSIEGAASRALSTERIAEHARESIEAEFDEQGVDDVSEIEPVEPRPAGDELIEYRGEYTIPEITDELEAGGERHEIVIDSERLPVAGIFSVWRPETEIAYVAGGAYPAENYENEVVESLSGPGGTSVDASVDVDLDLDPEALRQTTLELATTVE